MTTSQKNEKALEAIESLVAFLDPLLGVDSGDHEAGWHWKQIEGRSIVSDAKEALAALSQPTTGEDGVNKGCAQPFGEPEFYNQGVDWRPVCGVNGRLCPKCSATPVGGEVVTVEEIADKLFIEFDTITRWTRREIAQAIHALIQSRVGGQQ